MKTVFWGFFIRQFIFTASILTSLMVSSCAQDPQNEVETSQSPEAVSTAVLSAPQDSPTADKLATRDVVGRVSQDDQPALPEHFKDLDPQDISRAEIDELMVFQDEQRKSSAKYSEVLRNWQQQDPASRGPQPQWSPVSPSKHDSQRFRVLQTKFRKGSLRKTYEGYVPKTLSQDEVNELLVLEQAQEELRLEQTEKFQNWAKQDPATRGPQPDMSMNQLKNVSRLQELHGKVNNAGRIQRVVKRIDNLRARHNIPISDSEIDELTTLETEKSKLDMSLGLAMMKAQKELQLTGQSTSQADALNNIPKHLLQQIMEVRLRIDAIEAPLKAAETADRIQQRRMTKLSQESGISILPNEIDETIALTAEKFSLQKKTQSEAYQKWLVDGGPIRNNDLLQSDEDYARMKEIDARIKEISAPMNEAKFAIQDAKNPAMRQQRLKQEEREKWNTVWRDKKQVGEIPQDAIMNSPSYAELQDRVENYSAKLKSRADEFGYVVPETDVERLDTLNEDMLSIRKSVYDMEVDGSSMVLQDSGGKTPHFKLTAGMFKIELIQKKQREILATLPEAESFQSKAPLSGNSEIETQQFNHRNFGNTGQYKANGGAEAIIESFRLRGVDVSQEDADELLAFERALENR